MGAQKKEANEKPLEKMTVKELRELAKEITNLTGVHGMNKPELLNAVKQAKGIKEASAKQKDVTVREIKKKIRQLKAARNAALDANDIKKAAIYRGRIIRLKKKTRRAA